MPQRDFGIPRFTTYDEGILRLYGNHFPPGHTDAASVIRLALRYRSSDSLLRHFKIPRYAEIVDYPGNEFARSAHAGSRITCASWSRQMNGLLQGQRWWAAKWRQLCDGLDHGARR